MLIPITIREKSQRRVIVKNDSPNNKEINSNFIHLDDNNLELDANIQTVAGAKDWGSE